MKQFEVGKIYKVRPYSYTENGGRDYKHPQTMTVLKRTDTHVWCEVNFAQGSYKQTCKVLNVSKAFNVEEIHCASKYITADQEA